MKDNMVKKYLRIIMCLLVFVISFLAFAGCSSLNVAKTTIINNDQNDGLWNYFIISNSNEYSDTILNNKSFSLSFWIKPTTNKVGTVIFNLSDNNNNYIELTSSGYSEGNYSGLTLTNNNSDWIVANGTDTLQTKRYNYVVVNIENNKAYIYLDGEEVASGDFHNNLNNPTLRMGYSTASVMNEDGYISNLIFDKELATEEIKSNYETKYLDVLLDTLEFKDADAQYESLWLVDNEIDGIPVTYEISNEDIMDYRGVITRPDKDTEITLKANMYLNDMSASKEFILNILADTDSYAIKEDKKGLDADIEGVIYSGQSLPLTEPKGSVVTYNVSSGNAIIEGNKIIKTTDNEKENVVIEVTLTLNDEVISDTYNIVLLDEIEGYIMAYFNGTIEQEEERGKLAYSYDGLNWEQLNNGNPIITSELGTKRIRDPYISRDAQGNFIIVATEGFDNPSIYIMQSEDLINFSRNDLVQIAYYDAGLQMSGQRAWAPAITYDNENELYYIYFSDNGFDSGDSNNKGHILYVTTTDLHNFSYPNNFLNPGYTVIDGTIFTSSGYYWMFFKDERNATQTIYYATTNDLAKGFQNVYDNEFLINKKFMEGPFTLPTKDGSGRYIYVDNFPNQKFYVGSFTTLGYNSMITWLNDSEYSLPEEDVRHGSAIPVTKKELERIIANYNQ